MRLGIIRKRIRGAAIIEAAFTMPIILWIIFFILESIMINRLQAAIEAVAMECTFDFIVSKNTANFNTIIAKHLSTSEQKNLSWYFLIYDDLATMCTDTFGEDIIVNSSTRVQLGAKSSTHTKGTRHDKPATPKEGEGEQTITAKSGNAFVLTLSYQYKFSSALVSQFFSGGHNTTNKKAFILWSRGCGVCN